MSSKQSLYMETTEIAPEKTAGEITTLLVRSGARSIQVQYNDQQQPIALSFSLPVGSSLLTFVLPVRVEPIYRILVTRGRSTRLSEQDKKKKRAQAARVAWRQLLRWTQAQLAFIETGMVAAHEVFLPYLLHAGTQQTLFEYFSGEGMTLLTAAAGKPQ